MTLCGELLHWIPHLGSLKVRLMRVIVAILLVAVLATAMSAVAKKDAKYIGSEDCAVCHSDTHPTIVSGHAKTLHHSAMIDATKNPKAIVAVFGADAPFKKTDVKYVLGVGKVYQNYLDKNLKLLPGKWDAAEKKWVKIDSVDGATQCVGCHVTNFDPAKKTWTELGVGCEACHGPGSAHSDSQEAKDIQSLKLLKADRFNMVCGQCHANGTNTTGKYAFPTTFCPGDDLNEHFKLKPADETAPNSQYNQFLTSKHAAGNVIKCITCHDPHGDKSKAGHQLRLPVNDLCLGCHSLDMGDTKGVASLKEHAPTAGPDDTCATCHMKGGAHTFKPAKL